VIARTLHLAVPLALLACRDPQAPPSLVDAGPRPAPTSPETDVVDDGGPGDTCAEGTDCVVAHLSYCPCGRCPDEPPLVLNRRGARRAERDDPTRARCTPPGVQAPNCSPCMGPTRFYEPACVNGRCGVKVVQPSPDPPP
jgi:hypothetical protein